MNHAWFISVWLLPAAALAAAGTALPPSEPPTNSPGSAASSFDASAIFESARLAVIILRPVNARGQGNTKGTGFLIGSNGIVVTARHVAALKKAMGLNLADRSQVAAARTTLALEAAKLGHAAEAREALEQVRRGVRPEPCNCRSNCDGFARR